MTKSQLNLYKEITEHNVWSFSQHVCSLWAKKDLNIFSNQKLQGAYSLFSEDFLRFPVQKLLTERGLLLAGSCVWFALEDTTTPIDSEESMVSSGGWSRTSGAGGSGLEDCWQTGEELSLIHTSWNRARRRRGADDTCSCCAFQSESFLSQWRAYLWVFDCWWTQQVIQTCQFQLQETVTAIFHIFWHFIDQTINGLTVKIICWLINSWNYSYLQPYIK